MDRKPDNDKGVPMPVFQMPKWAQNLEAVEEIAPATPIGDIRRMQREADTKLAAAIVRRNADANPNKN